MTALTTTPRADRQVGPAVLAGIAAAAVATTLMALFAHDWGEVIVVAAGIAAGTAVVFGVVVPRGLRRESAGGAALTCAVLAALLVAPAFWSGIPLVLGVAAMILGNAGRVAPHDAGKSIAALVVGALASTFHLSIYVMEGFAGNTGFLLG
jgi:hypothetical protein